MSAEEGMARFQRWTLSALELLSATPDRQSAYARESNVDLDEIVLQFDDVLHVARARVSDGSLNEAHYLALLEVNERVDSVLEMPDPIWTSTALENSAEWRELRISAGAAKAKLEKAWRLTTE
ncbi:hypothetical protein [Streptomyces sp. NPDC054786]